jgi:DNA-binding transcriptional LysR family regulator
MDKLKCMETFVTAVDAGNFTVAGNRLGITAVVVGKQIRQLEDLFGRRLLNRNTRTQSLTEAGAALYRRARAIVDAMAATQSELDEFDGAPKGTLRVSAPVSMGGYVIAPLLASYQQRYPQVELELVVENRHVDLIDEGFDLAVRVGALADSGMVARPLPPYRNIICASPGYLARSGTPLAWADLARHRCLRLLAFQPEWTLSTGETLRWPVQGAFSTNDGNALRAAAIAGAGLILQPSALLDEAVRDGRLLPVLENFLPPPLPAHLVYLRDPYPRPTLSSLVDFLLEQLK